MKLYNLFVRYFFVKPRVYKINYKKGKSFYLFLALRHGIKKILGIYERSVSDLIIANIKKGDVCVDVGSHIGYFTILMAGISGNEGRVFSIEPIKENCDLIAKSLEKNNFCNTTVLNIGAGDRIGDTPAVVFEDSSMGNFSDSGFINYPLDKATTNFHTSTIDSLLQNYSLEKLNLIKIDVEGYEYKVLKGAEELIDKFHPKLVIEVHSLDIWPYVFFFLKDKQYTIKYLSNTSNVFYIFAEYTYENTSN